MSDLPDVFSTYVSGWRSDCQDAYWDIHDGIAEILHEHTDPSAAGEALQELLDPYRPDDEETAIYMHIWAIADGDRLGIGVPDHYEWYLFDDETERWYREGSTLSATSDGDPDYEIVATSVLNRPWWSNPEDAAELGNRVKTYRERVKPYISRLYEVDPEYNDEITAADLRDELIDYITAHGPDPATCTVEDISPDDDHTFLVVREDGIPKGHIAAVNPGESIDLADIEEIFDRDRESFLLVTDHLNFLSPPYDPGNIRKLDYIFDATHLIGLTLEQIMGGDPFPPYHRPEVRFIENHDYGGGERNSFLDNLQVLASSTPHSR